MGLPSSKVGSIRNKNRSNNTHLKLNFNVSIMQSKIQFIILMLCRRARKVKIAVLLIAIFTFTAVIGTRLKRKPATFKSRRGINRATILNNDKYYDSFKLGLYGHWLKLRTQNLIVRVLSSLLSRWLSPNINLEQALL